MISSFTLGVYIWMRNIRFDISEKNTGIFKVIFAKQDVKHLNRCYISKLNVTFIYYKSKYEFRMKKKFI